MGVRVHLGKTTQEFLGNGKVEGLAFADGGRLEVDMVVVSAGIRPRDELARACGLEVGPRGGVVVDDTMRTSDPDIFAIGEVAVHRGMIYGLVAPGYEMAEVAAANLAGAPRTFSGFDMSTKLKLMGVDVASFGDPFTEADGARRFTYRRSVRRRLQEARLRLRGHTAAGRHPGRRRVGLRHAVGRYQEREAAADATRRAAHGRQGCRLL